MFAFNVSETVALGLFSAVVVPLVGWVAHKTLASFARFDQKLDQLTVDVAVLKTRMDSIDNAVNHGRMERIENAVESVVSQELATSKRVTSLNVAVTESTRAVTFLREHMDVLSGRVHALNEALGTGT